MNGDVLAVFKDGEVSLVEKFKLRLIEIIPPTIVTNENTRTINGLDGVVPSSNTFAPMKIAFKLRLNAQDNFDYHLTIQSIKSFLNRRGVYYVKHDKLPYIQYATTSCDVSIARSSSFTGEVTLTFNVFKGCGESVLTTSQIHDEPGKWAIGGNLTTSDELKYKHSKNKFVISNLSDDVIDPLMRHSMKITFTGNVSTQLTISNKTTENMFIYKGSLAKNKELVIDGVFPMLGGTHVGSRTNHEIITLATGDNDFEVSGATDFTVAFDFNFLYR